jgi:hypothetical protein
MPIVNTVSAGTVIQVEDATDIALPNIANGYSSFGAAVDVAIPSGGEIRAMVTGRLMADATGSSVCYVGVRVDGVNYWFGDLNFNGSSNKSVMLSGSTVSGQFYEYMGEIANAAYGRESVISVGAVGLPIGNKNIQIVVARGASACSLRGSVTKSRIILSVEKAKI